MFDNDSNNVMNIIYHNEHMTCFHIKDLPVHSIYEQPYHIIKKAFEYLARIQSCGK